MDKLISIDELIEEAKKKGVDFGKGDPYNRLRYYTKIGWLPHMVRKKDDEGDVTGHYPDWALDQLVLIEDLKSKGFTNEDIAKKVQVKSKVQNVLSVLTSKETRNQIITYVTLILLFVILSNEMGLITIGKQKNKVLPIDTTQVPVQINGNGTAFVPKEQNKVFVKAPYISKNSKVYVTFTGNYTPATRYWVQELKDNDGFTVQLDTQVADNAEFNWWVSN